MAVRNTTPDKVRRKSYSFSQAINFINQMILQHIFCRLHFQVFLKTFSIFTAMMRNVILMFNSMFACQTVVQANQLKYRLIKLFQVVGVNWFDMFGCQIELFIVDLSLMGRTCSTLRHSWVLSQSDRNELAQTRVKSQLSRFKGNTRNRWKKRLTHKYRAFLKSFASENDEDYWVCDRHLS